ncbi:MAG: class I SAM-dependent methyltransferase [Proteobacteria bacterium]|nr:class I SAM-dependent methyltransferase [Pseudomonadota bacterium]
METDVRTIDWSAAWAKAQTQSRSKKPYREPSFWNKRARGFADHQNHKSDYPEQFISMLDLQPDWSVLDAGCGPGTLAIPLAKRDFSITAMDFSEEMLSILKERMTDQRVTGISPVLASMEDDWEAHGVEPHDVVIASRSMVTSDLSGLLAKLNRFARRKVYISAMVNPGPFDRRIIEAVGRTHHPGPDYIFILNQLYCMGIHARLDFTVHPVNRTYEDHDDALEESRWMLDDMTPAEEDRLRRYFRDNLEKQNGCWLLPAAEPVRWAVINWDTDVITAST